MKIVKASKLDDIRKARDEWESDYKSKKADYDEQFAHYKEALVAVQNRLQDKLVSDLSKFDTLSFDVAVHSYDDKHLEAAIKCGENKMFDDNVALAWDYTVEYKFGDSKFTKETGSWSGLKATTDAQIKWLEQSIEAIKYLNSLDWETLLNPEDLPKYDDYVTEPEPDRDSRPNFEAQEFSAQLDKYVGKDVLIKGTSSPNGFVNEGIDGWYKIYRETPKFYKVGFVSDSWIHDPDSVMGDNTERIKAYLNSQYNLRKDRAKEFIASPIETITLPDDLK